MAHDMLQVIRLGVAGVLLLGGSIFSRNDLE